MSERSFLAWCTGGGGGAIAGEPVIELKELEGETGGGNSDGCFGGGIVAPTGSTSTLDVDRTMFSEDERGLLGRFGGTGGDGPWITEV